MPYTHCGSVVRAIIMYIIYIYCPVVQLTTTGSWPSGQTQDNTLVLLLQHYGYKPVNTPLQGLYGIMHSCISLVPRPIPSFSMLHAEKRAKAGNGPEDEATCAL